MEISGTPAGSCLQSYCTELGLPFAKLHPRKTRTLLFGIHVTPMEYKVKKIETHLRCQIALRCTP